MNDFLIQFVGIVMFVAQSGAGPSDPRMAVVPLQRTMTMHQGKPVHAHVPYIAFPMENAVVDWNGEEPKEHPTIGGFGYFELTQYTLVVNAADPTLDVQSSHGTKVKRVKDFCPSFVYDDTEAAAAFVRIKAGELTGHVTDKKAAYSDWKVSAPGNLVITAIPKSGPNRTITLPWSPEIRIVIGNETQEFMDSGSDPGDHSHFYIYYKYDTDPNNHCIKKPSDLVPRKDRDKDSDIDCSNSQYP